MRRLAITAFFAAFLFMGFVPPLAADEVIADLGPGDGLVLQVPQGWVMDRRDMEGTPLVTLTFGPEVGDEFSVRLTPIKPEQGADPDFGSPASVYSIVEATARDATDRAAESELEIREFEGDSVGFYFWATDRELANSRRIPPGEYLHLTQGAVMVGELLCKFTILTNERPSGVIDAAMLMLRTAVHRTGT